MASYTVDADEVGVQNKTLAISTVDTVTFGADVDGVVVFSDGTAALYFTVDGTTPTIGGAKTHVSPAGVKSARRVTVPTSGNTVVKLISSGAVGYSVEASRDEAPILGAAVELGQTSLDALENVTATVEAGAAGSGAPSLPSGASGIIGWLRKLIDLCLSGVVVKTDAASPLLVESTSTVPTIVVDPDTGYDADDNLIAWTQNGVDYEATYDADGNLLTQGPA